VELTVKAGSLCDPPDKEGLANITASLLRYGTRVRCPQQLAEEIDYLGISLFSGAGRDSATITLKTPKKDLGPSLDIIKDILLNPRFSSTELSAMVQRLRGTLKSQEDEPGVVAGRAFRRHLFGDHPYGFPNIGTPESLRRIQRADLISFHRQFYRPNNAILTIVGDLTLEEAQKITTDYFGGWQAGEIPAPPPAPVSQISKPTVVTIDKDITQANIILGQKGIKRSDPDFYAFQLMNYILGGGGFASRLMDNIRDDRGLAYSIHSSFEPGLEPGPFDISMETKNASAGEAVAEMLKEIERIRRDLVEEKELAAAKAYLIGSLPMKMDSNARRAALLAYAELFGLGLDYPWRYPEIINTVTRDDILAVGRKYLDPERHLLVVVGKQQDIQLNLPSEWQQPSPNSSKGEISR